MANQKKHRWLPYLMVLPAFSIMVLVVVFPIVNTVARSFRTTDGRFTLDNYVYFFTSAEALQSLLFTLAEALTVMALSVVLSFLLSAARWASCICCPASSRVSPQCTR